MIVHGVLSHLIFFRNKVNPTGVLQITSQNLCKYRNIGMRQMQESKNAPPTFSPFPFHAVFRKSWRPSPLALVPPPSHAPYSLRSPGARLACLRARARVCVGVHWIFLNPP